MPVRRVRGSAGHLIPAFVLGRSQSINTSRYSVRRTYLKMMFSPYSVRPSEAVRMTAATVCFMATSCVPAMGAAIFITGGCRTFARLVSAFLVRLCVVHFSSPCGCSYSRKRQSLWQCAKIRGSTGLASRVSLSHSGLLRIVAGTRAFAEPLRPSQPTLRAPEERLFYRTRPIRFQASA